MQKSPPNHFFAQLTDVTNTNHALKGAALHAALLFLVIEKRREKWREYPSLAFDTLFHRYQFVSRIFFLAAKIAFRLCSCSAVLQWAAFNGYIYMYIDILYSVYCISETEEKEWISSTTCVNIVVAKWRDRVAEVIWNGFDSLHICKKDKQDGEL